jgi:enoyl-CoA hydratase/carnithine racemase
MEYKDIVYTKEAAVATITLNRPDKGNSFSPEMVASIQMAIADATSDGKVRVLVITGAGQAFCAGGDVKAMADQFAKPQSAGTRNAVTEGQFCTASSIISQNRAWQRSMGFAWAADLRWPLPATSG